MKTVLKSITVALFGLTLFTSLSAKALAYSNNNMIIDAVYDAKDSMSESDIRSFIAARPNTCLTRIGAGLGGGNIFDEPVTYFSYGPSKVDAARVIYRAAQYNEISPKVIISTLQKEQSLFTDVDCTDTQGYGRLNKAMGYACYEGAAACPAAWAAGFERQVMKGAWQLAFDRQRAYGNVSWGGASNSSIVYSGHMTRGYRQRCASTTTCPVTYFDGYASPAPDGVSTYLENGATAALYNYTPHRNQSFSSIFENFFGAGSTTTAPTLACTNSVNIPDVATGQKIVSNNFFNTGNSTFSLIFPNNTGSACIEAHTWGYNLQSWITNVATNHPVYNPSDGEVISANIFGDAKSELVFVKYRNTGSGRIEVHVWDSSYQRWVTNVATNHAEVDPANARVISADVDGNGVDELTLVKYLQTGSGRIEIHTWNPGQQSWRTNIATSYPETNPADAKIISANLYNGPEDEFVFIKYRYTGSGRIEAHTWSRSLQSWLSNVATNHPVVEPNDIEVISGKVYGNGYDQLVLVKYRGTGSGKVEIHTWGNMQQSWISNRATNYPAF